MKGKIETRSMDSRDTDWNEETKSQENSLVKPLYIQKPYEAGDIKGPDEAWENTDHKEEKGLDRTKWRLVILIITVHPSTNVTKHYKDRGAKYKNQVGTDSRATQNKRHRQAMILFSITLALDFYCTTGA